MSTNPYLLHGNELERTEAARKAGQSQPAPKPRAGEHTKYVKWEADGTLTVANARRIMACLDACEGITTEALEQEPYELARAGQFDALAAQNRELVEALRSLLADCDADTKPMGQHPARALLAKVRL